MATNRKNLFDGIANGAAWDAGVVFNRTNALPLDKYSVFKSVDEATTYASTNAVAYPGQVIAVVPEAGVVDLYKIEANGSISKVGGDVAADL